MDVDRLRVRLGLVSETSPAFLNQVKLLLYSLRRNAGALSGVPVTLVTNSEPLSDAEMGFFEKHFSPIEFKTCPRLGAIPHTSKLNVFYAIDPSTYDVLLYMDCDTLVRKPLDRLLDAITVDGAEFVCRRGGETDRNSFIDFNSLVAEYCGERSASRVPFEGKAEWPMFNSGVFLATPEAVRKIRGDSVEFTYKLYNQWQRIDAIERLPFTRFLFKLKPFRHRKKALADWPLEQGSLALACIKAEIKIHYLDEVYNSWGNLDFSILHCFKSAYRFDRAGMYAEDAESWLEEYSKSDLAGKVFLSQIIREFKRDIGQ
jgi:hypothetical protein